jgi:hypothetical protein
MRRHSLAPASSTSTSTLVTSTKPLYTNSTSGNSPGHASSTGGKPAANTTATFSPAPTAGAAGLKAGFAMFGVLAGVAALVL